MQKLLILAPLIIVSLLLSGAHASDVVCRGFKNARDHIDQADAIFEGRPDKSKIAGRDSVVENFESDVDFEIRKTRFRVVRVWKGEVPKTVWVEHCASDFCTIRFEPGELYKIFAKKMARGSLRTNLCLHPYMVMFEEGLTEKIRNWSEYESILGTPEEYE